MIAFIKIKKNKMAFKKNRLKYNYGEPKMKNKFICQKKKV